MGKPKPFKLKKPRLPAKPKEPKKYEDSIWMGEVWNFSGIEDISTRELKIETDNGYFEIELDEGNVNFYPLSNFYKQGMLDYELKLQEWNERIEQFQPEINIYEAAKLEYDIKLLEWKAANAKSRLEQTRQKIKQESK